MTIDGSPIASSQLDELAPVQLDAFAEPEGATSKSATVDYAVVASDMAGIVWIDPFAIEPEPFNGRGLATFDPNRNQELIEDMRARGNTVPVRLRPRADGQGWTCPSGSRRVNAARVIEAERPGFRVRAIIDGALSDAEAYELCLADNHGRSKVTPLQRGREIKWAIEHLHGGSRKAYIDYHGIDPSVVSRALGLVDLPEQILVCAQDREQLPTLFAEKLAPRLKDKIERKMILSRAKALGSDRLPASHLLRYLLTGERRAPAADRRSVRFGTGRNRSTATAVLAADQSATIKLPRVSDLSVEQMDMLRDFVLAQIDELIERATLS